MAIYEDRFGHDTLSKSLASRLHAYVNVAKGKLRARRSSGKIFHCTFCLEHGKVKAVGYNQYKQEIDWHRRLGKVKFFTDKNYHMCKHAEIDAILQLGGNSYDYSKMTFFNVHIDKNFHCKNSMPCKNCLRVMSLLGVKRVVYFDEAKNKFLAIDLKKSLVNICLHS